MTKKLFPVKLNIPEILSKGLSGWLMYEHYSYRADLFSEKYLAHGIGNLLNGNPLKKTFAERDHPVLKPHKTWAGRNPQLDFVQVNKRGTPEIVIESKFLGVGNSQLSTGDIIWDLIRLELVSHKYKNAKCYFLLAGKTKKINELFKDENYLDRKKKGGARPILPTPEHGKSSLQIRTCSDKRMKTILRYLNQYEKLKMPSVINVSRRNNYPPNAGGFDNSVYVWEITSNKKAPRFLPKKEQRIIDMNKDLAKKRAKRK